MQTIHFVLPDNHHLPTGGNLYNQHLIHALEQKTTLLAPLGTLSLGLKKMTWDDYLQVIQHEQSGIFILDTLFLDHLQSTLLPTHLQKLYLLVHYLPSLFPPEGSTSKAIFEQSERAILAQFHGFITTSQYTADYLTANGITTPIAVIPPALGYRPALTKSPLPPVQALMVANLSPVKGVLPFLKRLSEVAFLPKVPLKITIVGSWDMDATYARQCLEVVEKSNFTCPYGVKNRIHFTGLLSPLELRTYYERSHLFISTSRMETFGMALQEAVAHRLPIIALDRGNVGFHVKNGVNGALYASIPALVTTLEAWLGEKTIFLKKQEQARQHEGRVYFEWAEAAAVFLRFLADESLTYQ